MTKRASQFGTITSRLRQYFVAYGGWSAILASPLFHVSWVVAALSYNNWLHGGWVDQTFALIPSLLGFSLGTYAILFSLVTSRLKRALRAVRNPRGVTYLDEINATFLHFIFIQVVALFWAFVYAGSLLTDIVKVTGSSQPWTQQAYAVVAAVGSFFGMLLLVYSVALVVGAALAVYRLARIVDPSEG